ncbi:MAG: phage protease [Helicobacter sp.]|nr:phage protease [Helicobacter sp.]
MKEYLFVCEIGEIKGEDSFVESKIAEVGRWSGHSAGILEITLDSLKEIKKNFEERKNDCVIDYEHASINGGINPAAGWIKSLEVRENALFAKISWNDKAKEFIKNGEYKYLSPTFNMHYKNPKTGKDEGVSLHSAALTNTPFLDSLGEVKANKILFNEGEKMDIEKRVKELEAENESLKKQIAEHQEAMACSVVDSALVACKITEGQKEWALSYAKSDLQGFKSFLDTTQPQATPQNNLFVNSNTNKTATTEVDVVKLTLES